MTILGERTTSSASIAIREAAARLFVLKPRNPMNGNSTVLAGAEAIKIEAIVGSHRSEHLLQNRRKDDAPCKELESMREELLASSPQAERDAISGLRSWWFLMGEFEDLRGLDPCALQMG